MKHHALTLLAAALLGASPASASPLFELAGGVTGETGFNARSTGPSAASTYFNPALLAYAEQSVELGVLVLSEQISLTLDGRVDGNVPEAVRDPDLLGPDGNPISNGTLPTRWLEQGCPSCGHTGFRAHPRQSSGSSGKTRAYQVIGLVGPIFNRRLVLGIHALVPLGTFTTAYSTYPDEREQFFSNSLHPELYGDRMTATSLAFGLGSEILNGLSVGVSFTLNLTNVVAANAYIRDPDDFGRMQLSNDIGVTANVAPHFGVSWALTEHARLSATFHSVQAFRIDAGFASTLPLGSQSGTRREFVHDYMPWTLGVGGDWTLNPRRRHVFAVASTLLYSRWSDYVDRQGQSPSDYGSQGGWSNTVSPSLGVRYRWRRLHSRLDVNYVPSPVPLQVGRSNYVDNDRLGATLGVDYGFAFWGYTLRPGLALQLHRLLPRHQKKDPALLVDEFVDGAYDRNTGAEVQAARGLQTNNPGYPGFASAGYVYGGSVSLNLEY